MKEKIIFLIFLDLSPFFEEKNLIFWKNYTFTQGFPQPNFTIGLGFLAIFHRPWVCWALWKIAKPFRNCTWWSVEAIVWIYPKNPFFWQIWVFTKYGCFNAPKWPQMPHKWVNTIPFGSGHTLGTLNHGLGSLFCCFITLFGARGTDTKFHIFPQIPLLWSIMSHFI